MIILAVTVLSSVFRQVSTAVAWARSSAASGPRRPTWRLPAKSSSSVWPDRLKVAAERHIAAAEHAQPTGQSEAHTLVMAVPQPDRETRSLHLGFEIQDAEHLHSIR